MYFKRNFFIVTFFASFLLANFANALIFQSSDVALRNGMYETGYQERKAKQKANSKSEENKDINHFNFQAADHSSSVKNNQIGGPDGSVIAVPSNTEPAKDYNAEMANYFFGKQDTKSQGDKLHIINFNTSYKTIELNLGESAEIHFYAPRKVLWHFEKTSKIFAYVNQRQDKEAFILTYKAIQTGTDNLYFDSMEYKDSQVNVLESKILNINVR